MTQSPMPAMQDALRISLMIGQAWAIISIISILTFLFLLTLA